MRLISKIPALIVFSALTAFAQQEQAAGSSPVIKFDELKLGPRVAFSLNNFSSGYSNVDKSLDIKMGLGFGAGIALSIPITDLLTIGSLTLNPELNFLYRKLYGYTDPGIGVEFLEDEAEVDMTEFAASIPIMLRFTPVEMPFYVAAGVQLDIPFDPEFTFKENGRKASLEFEDRSGIDFGFAIGLGYNITERLSADFRWVIGLTNAIDNSDDKSSYDQFSLGITYLFSLPKEQEVKCECLQPEADDTKTEENLEVFNSQTIDVYKDERGTVLSMSDILFESGQAELKDELKMNLTEIAGVLKSFLTQSHIVIEGHTDNIGTAEFNQTLSEQRAGAVLQYLADRGIEKSKLKSVGYGLTKPIADNSTAEGRAKNRRVEIVITKTPNQEQ